jgi:hypothetical protein
MKKIALLLFVMIAISSISYKLGMVYGESQAAKTFKTQEVEVVTNLCKDINWVLWAKNIPADLDCDSLVKNVIESK